MDDRQLFDSVLQRVHEVADEQALKPPQAFGRWFAEMYFQNPRGFFAADGSGDAKVDWFFDVPNGRSLEHCILNTKYTDKYNATAPVAFYNEVVSFWQAFKNEGNRANYLKLVRTELRPRYKKLFHLYDQGAARLFFVTNSRKNVTQINAIKKCDVQVFHLEDLLQFTVDYIEDAMPHTRPLFLGGIHTVLSAGKDESAVPTSIVFARLTDFIRYMDDDTYDLLFARNVRLSLGDTPVNKSIRKTFQDAPKEFAFSNNGITLLCEKLVHDPGRYEVTISNPRVVNGSQTLHSIRNADNPSSAARVMVRIIEIPPVSDNLPSQAKYRKDVIHKIAMRSNQQNNIKSWDLISNDDYQIELSRFFRTKKLYYERRRKEWGSRRTELRSLGIKRGPDIKVLTQLIASFHWDRRLLGPIEARRNLRDLFDGHAYDLIRATPPLTVYQGFLLHLIVEQAVRQYSTQKHYVKSYARYMSLVLFALVVRSLQSAGAKWGSDELTTILEGAEQRSISSWSALAREAMGCIHKVYMEEARRYRKKHHQPLSRDNFFKAQGYVDKMFHGPVPKKLRDTARAAISA